MRTLGSWDGEGGPSWMVDFKDLDEQLRFLRKMVTQFRGNPAIRNLATKIIMDAGVPPKEKRDQAVAVGQWVQENVYYVHELPERFQTPTETLRTKAGDCDDFTTLIASLLESIGIACNLVTMSVNGAWVHIFPAAVMKNGRMLPLDATMKFGVVEAVNPVNWAMEKGKFVRVKIV